MVAVDTFTEGLRILLWTVVGLAVLLAVGWNAWIAVIEWRQKRRRQRLLREHRVVWDWAVDGGVVEPEPIDTEDMYPRSHVSMPDRIPESWLHEWR